MEKLPNVAGSPQQLTNTSNNLAAAEDRKNTASRWAKVLLGCYRTGDANDPEIYVGSIIAILCGYPGDVIEQVCNPLTGLPARSKWLPALAEVRAACEEVSGPRLRNQEWEAGAKRQLEEREVLEAARENRPTYDELRARFDGPHGEKWGITNPDRAADRARFQLYTEAELKALYPNVSRETQPTE